MSKPINVWFPTYIGDFFAVTASMSGHEVGAYQLIIAHLWKEGGAIQADDRKLAKLTKASPRQWREIKAALWPLFEIKGGQITHPSVTAEIEKARQNQAKRRQAGVASGASRRAASAQQTLNTCSANVEPRAFEGEGILAGSRTELGRDGGCDENERSPFDVIRGGRA